MTKHWMRATSAVALLVGMPLGSALAGGPTSHVDGDGCEIVSGYNQVNNCNSLARTDGLFFRVNHQGNAFRGESANTTAFASLYCAWGYAAYKGVVQNGATFTCTNGGDSDYANRSYCGQSYLCGEKPLTPS